MSVMCLPFQITCILGLQFKVVPKKTKMIRNIRRTFWNKYVSELEQRLCELNRVPVNISSVDDIEALAATV